MAFKFPFTNYHELNLTWILDQLKSLFEKSEENVTVIENYDGRLTAVETELPSVADTAQDAAQTAAAAASLAQTAKATADTAQENAIQAQSAAGTARQEAQDAQTAAASAIQAAQQAQATAQNFDGRITQAENDASEALEASQSFENRVQAAINTANNAASTATNAQGIATNANQNAAAALDKVGNLNDLKTSAKNNLVTALNEVSDKSVKDVQIDGQSIVASGIASIPLASSSRFGVIRPLQNGGVTIDAQGRISTARASLASIKTAIANYPVIVPSNQHGAVFYGLAKAAGDSTQAASSNEVGTYTEQAKAAILAMLGITDQLNAKQNAPTAAGMAGQVLGLDSSLNPVWINQSGGGDVSNCAPIIINTASGDIASFADGADNRQIRKIVGTIEPVQEGTGDPSPDNVRPISGWTGANIHGTAVNIFGGALLRDGIKAAISSATIDDQTKTIEFTSGASIVKPFTSEASLTNRFKANTQYTFLLTYVKTSGNNTASNMRIYYTDGSYTNITPLNSATTKQTTVTVSEAGKTVSNLTKTNAAGLTAVYYEESGIFEGVLTTNDFVPYTGNQISVTFPSSAGDSGTVYGGTLTLNPDRTGTLVVDQVSVDMGVLEWQARVVNNVRRICSNVIDNILTPKSDYVNPEALNEVYKMVKTDIIGAADAQACIGSSGYGYGDRLIINDSRITEPEQVQEILSGYKFVYHLKTPQTFQLTTEQVSGILSTLYGANNIWANTGDVTVEYPADTKLYIDNKFTELQALILEH